MPNNRTCRAAGITLIELLAAVAILAIVTAAALPIYSVYSIRAQRANAQAELLRCAQGMERHANRTGSYALPVDTDDDGQGDAASGPVSANICTARAEPYTVQVRSSDAAGFELRASAGEAAGAVADDGMLAIDHLGARRWDRNNDGDFDDPDEGSWTP